MDMVPPFSEKRHNIWFHMLGNSKHVNIQTCEHLNIQRALDTHAEVHAVHICVMRTKGVITKSQLPQDSIIKPWVCPC